MRTDKSTEVGDATALSKRRVRSASSSISSSARGASRRDIDQFESLMTQLPASQAQAHVQSRTPLQSDHDPETSIPVDFPPAQPPGAESQDGYADEIDGEDDSDGIERDDDVLSPVIEPVPLAQRLPQSGTTDTAANVTANAPDSAPAAGLMPISPGGGFDGDTVSALSSMQKRWADNAPATGGLTSLPGQAAVRAADLQATQQFAHQLVPQHFQRSGDDEQGGAGAQSGSAGTQSTGQGSRLAAGSTDVPDAFDLTLNSDFMGQVHLQAVRSPTGWRVALRLAQWEKAQWLRERHGFVQRGLSRNLGADIELVILD